MPIRENPEGRLATLGALNRGERYTIAAGCFLYGPPPQFKPYGLNTGDEIIFDSHGLSVEVKVNPGQAREQVLYISLAEAEVRNIWVE